MYSNWPFAFWRELFQNSTDANAAHIYVTVEQRDDLTVVTFNDDGIGMSLETLTEVYFNLGASTKDNETTVGGFGRARILTNFSMLWYTIETRDLKVLGDGAEYEVVEPAQYIDGCHMTIGVDATVENLMRELERYLSYSQLVCQVFVNGEMWTNWGFKRRLVRHLEVDDEQFAAVHVSEEGFTGRVIVRVNGTTMFTDRTRAKAQVVIEIIPAVSRKVLTGNRDGFQVRYGDAVRAFLNEVAVNTRSSLKARRRERWETIPGDGALYTMNENALDRVDATDPARHQPDLYVLIDTDDKTIIRALPQYRKHGDSLMRSWTVICDAVISKMLAAAHLADLRWAVGWYLGDPDVRAKYTTVGDVAVFLLNPFRLDGSRIRADRDLQDLVASAKHEVAHVISSEHDEHFANVLSQIDSAVVFKEVSLQQRIGKRVARIHAAGDGVIPSMSIRQIRVLMFICDAGPCTRTTCMDTLWQLADDESMYGKRRQGQTHWAHPTVDNLKERGMVTDVGGSGKSVLYGVTALGRRVYNHVCSTSNDEHYTLYQRARDWWREIEKGNRVPPPPNTFRKGPMDLDRVEQAYLALLNDPDLPAQIRNLRDQLFKQPSKIISSHVCARA